MASLISHPKTVSSIPVVILNSPTYLRILLLYKTVLGKTSNLAEGHHSLRAVAVSPEAGPDLEAVTSC